MGEFFFSYYVLSFTFLFNLSLNRYKCIASHYDVPNDYIVNREGLP